MSEAGPKVAVSRRSFLKAAGGIAALSGISPFFLFAGTSPRVAVIGAGAFGGWTALHLLRHGAQVTLLDAWGPGNSRASSGGETRVIRAIYGPNRIYTEWTVRSLQLWKENEQRWKQDLYTRTGALWMIAGAGSYETSAIPLLQEAGLSFEKISSEEASRRYPQVNFDGVKWVLIEPEAGFLLARQSCQAVVTAFLSEGGKYRQLNVKPGSISGGRMESLTLSDGTNLSADRYVFACGPWLGQIFPEVLRKLIRPTRQEVFFFGSPPGDMRFNEGQLPVWVYDGDRLFYGVPGNQNRGLKIADDTHGPQFDPTSGERVITSQNLQEARHMMERLFPALKGAPLVESRVCQYENSPDSHFIIDRHPEAENVWLAGGGSGHGFKHGPALGEYLAETLLGKRPLNPFFQLSRFVK